MRMIFRAFRNSYSSGGLRSTSSDGCFSSKNVDPMRHMSEIDIGKSHSFSVRFLRECSVRERMNVDNFGRNPYIQGDFYTIDNNRKKKKMKRKNKKNKKNK